jgi:hypothetical protein
MGAMTEWKDIVALVVDKFGLHELHGDMVNLSHCVSQMIQGYGYYGDPET